MTTTAKGGAEHRLADAAKKEQRRVDAAKAMREYEQEKTRVDANTARLRALRLAQESQARAAEPQPEQPPKAARRAKPARSRA